MKQLEEYLDRYPELRRKVRLEQVRDFRLFAGGILLELDNGTRVRLYPKQRTQGRRDRKLSFYHKLVRQAFRKWRIVRVLSGTDRLRHQTAAFLRLILERGPRRLAVLVVYAEEAADLTNRVLSSAVLWWDRLGRKMRCERMLILMPEDWSERLLLMLPRFRIRFACYKYRPSDPRSLRQIYPRPIDSSEIRSPYVMFRYQGETPSLLREMQEHCSELDLTYRQDRWELGYLGLRVLWYDTERKEYLFDLQRPTVWTSERHALLEKHLREVMKLRRFPPSDAGHFCYRACPEQWLESLILQDHRVINPDFDDVIYSQVPTCLDGERKILDLLTVTTGGRLAVMELKIHKDLDLIFQGLDYWERVEHHLRQGDFEEAGYFEGKRLSQAPPLLCLISPLFEYHRVLPILRRHLNRGVSFTCIGVNTNWKEGLKVLRRFDF